MSTFRDDLGVALERIARLEDENRTLRAELLRAAPAPRRRWNGWSGEAACWSALLLVFVGGAALAATTNPTSLDDIGFGCTTPFTYQVANGETRAACLSMPP